MKVGLEQSHHLPKLKLEDEGEMKYDIRVRVDISHP